MSPSDTTTATQTPAASSPVPRPSRIRRVVRFLLGSERIREARAKVAVLTGAQAALLSRARLAGELADRVMDPVDPLRAGPATALALDLYRQAIYWALLCAEPKLGGPSFEELWR